MEKRISVVPQRPGFSGMVTWRRSRRLVSDRSVGRPRLNLNLILTSTHPPSSHQASNRLHHRLIDSCYRHYIPPSRLRTIDILDIERDCPQVSPATVREANSWQQTWMDGQCPTWLTSSHCVVKVFHEPTAHGPPDPLPSELKTDEAKIKMGSSFWDLDHRIMEYTR